MKIYYAIGDANGDDDVNRFHYIYIHTCVLK